MKRNRRDGSVVESTSYSYRGPWVCSQDPLGCSQLSVTIVPGNLMPSMGARHTCAAHTYIHIYIHGKILKHTITNKSKTFKTTPEKVKSKTKQQQQQQPKVPSVPGVVVHASVPARERRGRWWIPWKPP